MSFPADNTNLVISGAGLSPYAVRGLTQTWKWLAQATQIRRTINGNARDISLPQFRKLESTITGSDQRPPFAYRPGAEVTVDCLFNLSYLTSGGAAERTVVSGSSFTEGDWTHYRPQLVCLVQTLDVTEDEWAAGVQWNMVLTEK